MSKKEKDKFYNEVLNRTSIGKKIFVIAKPGRIIQDVMSRIDISDKEASVVTINEFIQERIEKVERGDLYIVSEDFLPQKVTNEQYQDYIIDTDPNRSNHYLANVNAFLASEYKINIKGQSIKVETKDK